MRLYELKTDLKQTLPPEFEAIQTVYNWMLKNNVQQISWRDFQKTFQQIGQKFNYVIEKIRHNQPIIQLTDVKAFLDNYKSPKNYDITYGSYKDKDTSFRAVQQIVMQINRNASLTKEIKKDRLLAQYLDMVAQSSIQSGHPVTDKTVGWLRIDEINSNWLLIDEVQSDLVNSVNQAKAILNAETYEDFEATLGEKGRQMLRAKVSQEQFYTAKQQIPAYGYTIEKLDEIKGRLTYMFRNWLEEALSSLIEVARQSGIRSIALHTAETIAQRDPLVGTETDKIKMFYDNLAKSFGFKKEAIMEPEFEGTFWVKDL